MAITVSHPFVSAVVDGGDATQIRPSNWNATHTLTGTVDIANGGTGASTAATALAAILPSQAANNYKVLGTDGTTATWISSNFLNIDGGVPSSTYGGITAINAGSP